MADRSEGGTYSNTGGVAKWQASSGNPEPVREVEYQPSAHRGGVVRFDGATGNVETQGVSTVQTGARDASDPLDNARDGKFKSPIPRSALKNDSIIRVNGVEGDLLGFIRIGAVEKMGDGTYRMASKQGNARPFDSSSEQQDGPEQTQQQQQQQEQQEPSERLDPGVEDTINTVVQRLGVSQTVALAEHAIRGNDVPNMGELASKLNLEPAKAQEVYDRTVSAFRTQAQSAAASVGVDASAWADFCSWAATERPNEKHAAEMAHFEKGRTSGIRALAKEFLSTGRQFSDNDLLNAEFGSGITANLNRDGQVILDIPGRGTIPARQAIKLGIIRISKKR
jgi:hypothetical protein